MTTTALLMLLAKTTTAKPLIGLMLLLRIVWRIRRQRERRKCRADNARMVAILRKADGAHAANRDKK